jgi:hypothetical protein
MKLMFACPGVILVFLTLSPYDYCMKATITGKGQITIPAKIRKKHADGD